MSRVKHLAWILAAFVTVGCEAGTSGSGARILSVEIATPSVILSQAETQQVTATIRDADGNTLETVSGVTWSSANNAVVSVTQAGQVRGVALGGPVTITVSVDGKSATTAVTVVPARIDITPGTATLAVGATRQLSGAALDVDGNPISGAGTIAWISTNSEVVSVSSTGLAHGVAAGNAVISASVAGRTSTVNLEVGVPSQYDGHWAGNSTTPGPRTYPIEFDVVFGTVRAFRFTFTATNAPTTGAQCSVTVVAQSQGTSPIVNNTFQVTLPQPASAGAAVSGTFASATTMTATHASFSFPGLTWTCSNGTTGSPGSTVEAGTIAGTRQ